MDDIIRDNQGNKITSGDRVNFYCKNDSIMKEGLITKMTGGTFGIKCSRYTCLLYTSPSPRDRQKSRMPSSA